MRPRQRSGGGRLPRLTALSAAAALAGGLCLAGTVASVPASASPAATSAARAGGSACHLADGIKHVVQLGFDNVHFFRDNPDVPSDLELMPNLLKFIEDNGTLLSNSHTPLIAHTADDLLTTATGLYGDRQGEPISNSYQAYNADGTTDPAGSFTYWTDPVDDTASAPNAGHDTNPNLVYSPVPPATARTPVAAGTVTPAPWVPYTRAGCNVGEIATVNQELENPAPDIADAFGADSPEAQQLAADTDPYKDAETADYVGLAVHCAKGAAFCANAEAVKYGQTSPSHTAVPDLLPDEPGGYNGYQALFGAKYVAPELGAGTPNLANAGVPVTNAAGNLTDEFGNQINGAYLTSYPGFPGYGSINAPQSLSYAADMLQHGVQVVNLYISDLHGNQYLPQFAADCDSQPDALGSGSKCYIDQAEYYNSAFGVFFKRLAADGITPKNTLFVVSSDEGDHEAGANVGRAVAPSPAGLQRRDRKRQLRHPWQLLHLHLIGLRRDRRQRDRPALRRDRQHHAVQHGRRHRAGVLPDRQPGPRHPGGANLRARRRQSDQPAESLLGPREREDRQLPREPGRGRHSAHGERRPGPDADAGPVRPA